MNNSISQIKAFNKSFSPVMQLQKYKALQENPMRFYRGTCHLFYNRFQTINHLKDKTKIWICGDLHLENFGSFKGNNRLVYFDLNDFDEAVLAPLSWEIIRLSTAILVASSMLDVSKKEALNLTNHLLEVYKKTIENGKSMMLEREIASGIMKTFFDQVSNRKRTDFIDKHTTQNGKNLEIKIDGLKTIALKQKEKSVLKEIFRSQFEEISDLKNFQILDIATRVAGTGSIGLERYFILVKNEKNEKIYALDLKEAKSSCLLKQLKTKQPKWGNEAERIVTIQNRLQFCTPAMIHTIQLNKKHFVLKELQPIQDKMDFSLCEGKFEKLKEIIEPMAELTAYAHLRGSGRQKSSTADEIVAQVNQKKWQAEMLDLSHKMSKLVLKDWEDFKKMPLG